MKLRTKIAGTLALPLALAVASAANAATVVDNDDHTLKIGGFVAAQAVWEMPDAGDANYVMDLGTSRLNVAYTKKTSAGDVTVLYENDWSDGDAAAGDYRLRHAAIMYDGWVAGQTWSFFANLNGLGETLDANGNAITSSWANRNAVLGKNISLGDDMSVGIALEDRSQNSGNAIVNEKGVALDDKGRVPDGNGGYTAVTDGNKNSNTSAVPDITANFKAKVGGVGLFAAAQYYQVNDLSDDKKSEGKVRFTASAAVPIADVATAKVAFNSDQDKYNAVSLAGQFKINDQIRTNLVVEQYMDDGDDKDYTQFWVNAIYKMDAGLEWGAEVHMVSADDAAEPAAPYGGAAADKDMTFRLQARYAF
ncbi:DcaP family trimeric outer membrane transporter [Marinospirillum insulare]|uniref:Porin n=1 Tax=Marinospirillum insulare TaxID=217169 RepID=A0ABQ5ZZT4_9GAMM|nr:DcaP family trimeric outer membrane transporter [Marinospirillum insulare]GLR63395.1 hypothetical protein GCM10007878_08300 [Marinospirillum insulare]